MKIKKIFFGDENIDVEGNIKTNISTRLKQTREIEEGLEVSDISITSSNGKSEISFIVTNDTNADIEELKLEIKVRDIEDQDICSLMENVSNVNAGEEKKVTIKVDSDIANAKDIEIKRIIFKEI